MSFFKNIGAEIPIISEEDYRTRKWIPGDIFTVRHHLHLGGGPGWNMCNRNKRQDDQYYDITFKCCSDKNTPYMVSATIIDTHDIIKEEYETWAISRTSVKN